MTLARITLPVGARLGRRAGRGKAVVLRAEHGEILEEAEDVVEVGVYSFNNTARIPVNTLVWLDSDCHIISIVT